MDALQTRWLLSILLSNLAIFFTLAGTPALPSPKCYIPFDEKNQWVNIYCSWNQIQGPEISTNYSLHWKTENSEEERHVISETGSSGYIDREHLSIPTTLRVWVQAKNQHVSARSKEILINTENIIKPPPPKVTSSDEDISWNYTCTDPHSMGNCQVRHRIEEDQDWHEEEPGYSGSFTLESPQPCKVHEVQVRCGCGEGRMSDWSEIHKVVGSETTPVGALNVWRDCGITPASLDCVLIWKRLPVSQACGLILAYEVKLSYSDGSARAVNVSTAGPGGQLVCESMQCYLTHASKGASSVSVSAYNAHGPTMPSYLTIQAQGKKEVEQVLNLTMGEENLTVSWNLTSQLFHDLKEYVVQYKQVRCPLGQGFDWIRVDKNQRRATFKGHFKKYTPYQVSLFTVSHSGEVHHLSSKIGYSDQKTPSKVQSFKVLSFADTHVTLQWEQRPLAEQNGSILYYQVGVKGQNVYKVSASLQHGEKTFQLRDLRPEQEYEVWIRAVNEKGPGENTTLRFNTEVPGYFAKILVPLGICTILICIIVVVSAYQGLNKWCPLVLYNFGKVPDPSNSHIFKEMKQQINDPTAWICIPVNEQQPKISLLEILEIKPWASKSSLEKTSDTDKLTRAVVEERSSQMDCQDDQREDAVTEECHKTNHKYERKTAYSKMVDSDEERDRNDCWSSSEEEPCTSGYEKHFMPTALEILEVL